MANPMDALATLGNWMAGIGLGSLFLYVLVLSTLLKCLRRGVQVARTPRQGASCQRHLPSDGSEP